MFVTDDVWMVFRAAKLATVEVDGVEHRMAECQLVVDPLPFELAQELGEGVSIHLFTEDGAIRPELGTITLDPRVPDQAMFARGAEGAPATEIRVVEVLSMTCARQVDDKTGREWIKATIRVRFDFAPKVHREWIAMYFGLGFYASFEAEQGDILAGVSAAVGALQARVREDGANMTIVGPGGAGVRITADDVVSIAPGE